MREIKFREWDQLREEFYGKGHGMSYSEREEYDDSVSFRFAHQESYDFRLEQTDERGTPYRNLMQYTGLKDINGVEIYEGDIVHRRTHLVLYGSDLDDMVDNYYLVEWKYGGWHIGEDLIDLVSEAGINGQTLCEETALQVVGNIYENPELLQKEADE